MTAEFLDQQMFRQEVESTGEVWVVKGEDKSIFALQLDQAGFSLPVWSGRDRVIDFLASQRLVGSEYEPHAVPLAVFTEIWLSDNMMGIAELLINIDGRSQRALVQSVEQFVSSHSLKIAV